MVSRVLPGPVALALWAALLIGAGVWLGAFDTVGAHSPGHRRAAKTIGLAAFVYGTIMAVGAAGGASDPLRPLAPMSTMSQAMNVQPDFATVFSAGQLARNIVAADGRPSLVYVTADWCITCAAIERNVLADARVRAGLAGFNRVRVDVSDNSSAQQDLMRSLGVAGPPTMFIVDGEAREVPGSRLVGDVAVEALLAASAKAAPRP
jgi:thiol:disulfide interchange protein DsbD